MEPPRKVFLSYRSVDRERVRVVAEALLAQGIDAWWDVWEIRPGDNFVSKINEGLDKCECGVVFLSDSSQGGAWHQDEISILKTFAVDEKRPLIPVLLDAAVKVPAYLRPYSRLSADRISELADAILQRTANKPPLGSARPALTRRRFSIHLRELANSAVGVSAQLDGKPLVGEQSVTPGAGFAFSYAEFVGGRPEGARQETVESIAARLDRDLMRLGEAVGRVVFPGDIDAALSARLKTGASGALEEIELVFEAASGRLLSIPFEAARLADGRIPALTPGVFVWRRPALPPQTPARGPTPGPLKILVAVGAPDEGKTRSSALDMERELQTVLDAVETARRLGNAYVRILEIGSAEQIGAALRQASFHVLHLSGHGNQGILELEDEDGNAVPTSAGKLAAQIRESGHPSPLIVLASCHSGRGDQESASFAQGLLDSGVPAVLAMQTAVSDYYATALAGKFYAELASAEEPLASRALALARRQLEQDRTNRSQALPDDARLPEYATPSLFLRDEEQAVLNRALDQIPVPETAPIPASGTVPMLKIGDLIGRRREVREILRVLTDDPRSVSGIGRKAGCQILGSGGVGKSSVAGRVMQRMADRGWPVVTVSGFWNVSAVANGLSAALWSRPEKDLAALARNLADPEAKDELRLAWIQAVLRNHKVLLVLDNFEDLLTPAGTAFRDPVLERVFGFLLESCQHSKLLITSRYPVPRGEARLQRVPLGPLSPSETRKLMLRHEGLKRQTSENTRRIERAIGGHPRTLEYLDALLRNGRARLETVQERLEQFARREGISLGEEAPFEEHVRDAIRLAAADAMVGELLHIVGQNPADLALLWQASVFPFPVPVEALAFNPDAPEDVVDVRPLAPAVSRLAATSLLTPIEDKHIYVHRWTAESLKPAIPIDAYQTCCLRAARYLMLRPVADRRQWVADRAESVRLFLMALAFNEAAEAAWGFIDAIEPLGQTTLWTELAHELAAALPAGHDDKSRFLRQEADGLLALGAGNEALERYRVALRLDGEKVAREPGRLDYLRDLSVSYNKMGDLLRALGEGEAARQFYEKALEIGERLVTQEPGRADYLRDLSVSYERMGDLQSALGAGDPARQFHEKALELRERLVAREPGRAGYLRDLSVSYRKMGDLQRAPGAGEEARQFYEKALEITERLVAQEPGRADYLRDLSVSYIRMGDLQGALGVGDRARQFYEKALELRERLVEQEPGRADYLRDLFVSYNKMGDVQSALGEGEVARQFYEKALEIAERLVAQEPGRADSLRDLSVSYNKMGDLQGALGDGEVARQFYEKALEIAERLVAQEPGRADYLRDLSVSYNKMGDLQSALGEGEAARQFYERALELRERLVAQEPGRADYKIDLAKSLARVGDSESLQRAFDVLTKLRDAKQLMPADAAVLDAVKEILQKAKAAGAAE